MTTGGEPLGGVVAPQGQRGAPVVDPHGAGVVVAAQLVGGVQGRPRRLVERDEVADGQAGVPERGQPGPVRAGLQLRRHVREHHGLRAGPGLGPLVGQVPPGALGLGDQGGEQPALLPVVGQQVVVEEAGPELLVHHPAVQGDIARGRLPRPVGPHGLAATGPGEVVPARGRAVGGEHVELHEVDVQPALHRVGGQVEVVGREGGQHVVQPQLHDVGRRAPLAAVHP